MTRTGKIARLPQDVRDELNQRLENGEPGAELLAWLNSLPDTKRMLAARFGGHEINHPNLTAWRSGGFRDWRAGRELREQARKLAAGPAKPGTATEVRMSEHLLTVLAFQYADVVMNWKGDATPEFQRKLRALSSLCKDTMALCRLAQQSKREALERAKANRTDLR